LGAPERKFHDERSVLVLVFAFVFVLITGVARAWGAGTSMPWGVDTAPH
jgi:hypothetical protein